MCTAQLFLPHQETDRIPKKKTSAAPHLPQPVGGGRPGGVEGLDHGGVRHVRAPAQVHEVAVSVDRRAAPVRYSRGDVLPGVEGRATGESRQEGVRSRQAEGC